MQTFLSIFFPYDVSVSPRPLNIWDLPWIFVSGWYFKQQKKCVVFFFFFLFISKKAMAIKESKKHANKIFQIYSQKKIKTQFGQGVTD